MRRESKAQKGISIQSYLALVGVHYCGCLCIENGCGRNERDGKNQREKKKEKGGTTKWMENVRPANHTIKYVRCR